jgi:diphthamide biosynthesis protein 2
MIWLGPPSSPALAHLQLTHSAANWARVDPSRGCARAAGLGDGLDRLLKRRYYLIQRCKAAPILGLLVGTLGAARYRQALDALRALAASANRKAYTLLMGKPSPAKLANFPEIGAFVMVAEPQGLLLDCAEYLAPVVTPYEALLALTDAPFDAAAYRLDYGPVLEWWAKSHNAQQQQRVEQEETGSSSAAAAAGDDGSEPAEDTGSGGVVAALAGGLALAGCGPAGGSSSGGGAVTTVGGGPGGGVTGALAVTSAAEYLAKVRTFRGLETPATGAPSKPPELAAEGRSGRAAGYEDEP